MLYMLYKNTDYPGEDYLVLGKSDSASDWQTRAAKLINAECQRNKHAELGLVCAQCLTPELEDFLLDTLGVSEDARLNFVEMMTRLADDQVENYEYCLYLFTPDDFNEQELLENIEDIWNRIDVPI